MGPLYYVVFQFSLLMNLQCGKVAYPKYGNATTLEPWPLPAADAATLLPPIVIAS